MKALVFDGHLTLRSDYPTPVRPPGEALVRVRLAGICNTDLEIVRGYMGFKGVLGHEFVGEVVEADDPTWRGKRVVGEINCPCGTCELCQRGLGRHCPDRTVLGIQGRDGAFADFLLLPLKNLHAVPDSVPDEDAVFTELLAAAFEIPEQVSLRPSDRAAVLGDGKLGALVAQVLAQSGCDLVVVGLDEGKLARIRALGLAVARPEEIKARCMDLVVDATGSSRGFEGALRMLRPKGTLVLKSTVAERSQLHLAPLVVDEITVVGSRCGPFEPALRALERRAVRVGPFIEDRVPFDRAEAAFERASKPGSLKVLLDMRAGD